MSKLEINLLGHCLLCLDKTSEEISSSPPIFPITRMTFANKVLPQLLLQNSAEKEKSIKDLFNRLHFCSSGGDGGDQVKGKEGDETTPPPLCSSCLEKLSTFIQLQQQLQIKKEEIRSKISGRDAGAFGNFLRGSGVKMEEDVKQRTLLLLDCLREECCEGTATTSQIIDDDEDEEDGSISGGEEEDELNSEEEINEEDDDDIVELPPPPPKEVPVVDISDDEEVDEDDLNMADLMVSRDDQLVVEVDPQNIMEQDYDAPGGALEILELGPSKKPIYCCPEADCGKIYKFACHLARHLKLAHGPLGKKPFICKFCGNGYKYKYYLKNHVESQHLRTNFICDVCGKGFAGNCQLNKHYQSHLGIKPFQCPNQERGCRKGYTDKRNLSGHLSKCAFGN